MVTDKINVMLPFYAILGFYILPNKYIFLSSYLSYPLGIPEIISCDFNDNISATSSSAMKMIDSTVYQLLSSITSLCGNK
jgi:hypothetical protein